MWIDGVLKEEYTVVKTLKKTEDKALAVYRHKTLGKDIVVRKCKHGADAYKILTGVSSKNLPLVYDVFENDDTVTVLEEYIDGVSVSDILAEKLYDEKSARAVAKELCDALFVLHNKGIVYRDIKPENVLIDADGTVKLIDFDAARIFKIGKSQDTVVMGTAGYAAPEQLGLAQTDERTDIYSLGVMMNVMLTGEHPSKKMYTGKLRKIIEKCIQIDPKDRYADAVKLKRAL